MLVKEHIIDWFQNLQDRICNDLETLDGKAKFHQDLWTRPQGGGGRTRIIQKGNLIEKGGVNFSAVTGNLPEKILNALKIEGESSFLATGVSIVLHPNNPHMPIIHMNVRYFEMESGLHWFGGGIDLTPHFIVDKDARFFHQSLKDACDKHHSSYHPKFKEWADNYFYIPHRNETRGIGGIFFDRLSQNEDFSKEDRFNFVKEIGNSFVPIYSYFAEQNRNKSFSEAEKKWQYLRRSRYVEFNLVYDKGTKFGLETAGRIESILMSMPPQAHWDYNVVPSPGSQEAYTQSMLKKEVDWLA